MWLSAQVSGGGKRVCMLVAGTQDIALENIMYRLSIPPHEKIYRTDDASR